MRKGMRVRMARGLSDFQRTPDGTGAVETSKDASGSATTWLAIVAVRLSLKMTK